MLRYHHLVLGLILALAVSCTAPTAPAPAARPATVTVLAAASLAEAFGELGQQFETQHSGVRLTFNFAGSQQLAQQLAQGAPADVFASANDRQMQAAIDSGRVPAGSPQTFARNRLVVIAPASNPGQLVEVKDLARPGLRLVMAAKEVPAGQYSLEFLDKAGQDAAFGPTFQAAVMQNVVSYEENVRAVLSKVTLGEADAGIVYVTDAATVEDAAVKQIAIPDALNVIATYPIAPIADSAQPDLAASFIQLILSPAGQTVLARHGFDAASP